MSHTEEIQRLLRLCSPAQRLGIFRSLRQVFPIHPLEAQLNTEAEVILEAIQRAAGLTLRMIRGVIAEAAFRVEVVERLRGWRDTTPPGDLAYDYWLEDSKGPVRVQVKLQRSREGRPMRANEAVRAFPADMYVAESQKTRAGRKRKTGGSTRPYRFGEFDLLAVAMQPSTNRWDSFLYTVANWLLPSPTDAAELRKFQPVAATPNEDWTDNFRTAVAWFRSGLRKTIQAE
jgi:hypothetical protein